MKRQTLSTLLLILSTAISTSVAQAAVRVTIPPAPGVPAYARTDLPLPHNDEWAFIVFYRDPGCVPADFNLLQFFDAPAAFECPLTVEGFEIWKNGPTLDEAPILSHLQGLGAVPVWFVAWPALEAAIADGVLTITDLEAMESLQIGYASFFEETLRPTGGVQHPTISLVAHGDLLDGRSFHIQATAYSPDVVIIFK